jgi:hypothetical protein
VLTPEDEFNGSSAMDLSDPPEIRGRECPKLR